MRFRVALGLLALVGSLSSINSFAAVGRTVGQFAVSQTGSAQYTIPIWAPPGPRGMQPKLSLFYDSRNGIGPLGLGWSITGLGQITRCNKTVAQDTTPAPVALVTSDGYCINGNRLRLTSGTYGAAGSVYQTEIADFSRVTAVGTTGNGPQSFTVQGRNGLTYYYGYTDSNGNGQNSQVIAAGSSPSTALTWLLSKVVDRSGNNYVINYTTLGGALIGTAVPSTIYWTPTSAGGSSYTYTMQFNYPNTNVPQSSITKYVGGTHVSNTALLASIEILYGSTVVKDYFIGYTASPTTGRDQITSVTECPNTTESSANCLSPTSISYGGPTRGVSTTANTALSSGGANLTARYDLNGDGIPDLVYEAANGSAWYVAFGSPSGYGTPVNIGINSSVHGNVLIGNLTGQTEDGVLANNNGTWYYYTWNGTEFTGVSTGLAYDSTNYGYQLADINGDGLPDLIVLNIDQEGTKGNYYYNAIVSTRLNTSSGSTVSFSSTLTSAFTAGSVTSAQLQTPDSQYGKLRRFDFNGDGRDDAALYVIGGSQAGSWELLSNGSTFTAVQIPQTSPQLPLFVNWNDDACTDYVLPNNGSNTIYISGCNGTLPTTLSVSGTIVAAMDWDGDGRTDLVVSNGSTLGAYLSTGSSLSSLVTTAVPYSSNCAYVTMDATGGGVDDLGCWSQSGSGSLTYYLHNGVPDLVTKFADGYGNSVSPSYVTLTSGVDYTEYANAVFPYQNYIGPLYVVNQATYSDPSSASGGTYQQAWWYAGAMVNLQGRGFMNIRNVQRYDSRTGIGETWAYAQVFPQTGLLIADFAGQNNEGGAQIFYLTNTLATTTLNGTANNESYFPYVSNATTTYNEVAGVKNGQLITTSSTTYTYDNYGNATNIATTVTDNDSTSPASPYVGDTWTTTTTNTTDISANQSADLAAWCLNMLDETQVVYISSFTGSTSVTRTKAFTPDTPSACRIKTIVTEPTANSGLYKVTEGLTFDSFGNVATDTVTGANMPSSPASREAQLNWGTTGQFLNTLTDPSSATTTWTYTSNQALTFGVPDSIKNANALTTSWGYDAFGRKTSEKRPDSTSTTWTWSTCTSQCGWSNSVYQVAQSVYQTNGSTVIRTDANSYDPVDRVTQTVGPTVTGTTATVQKLYNSLGLLTQQSLPFLSGATAYQKTYLYDPINRLHSVTRPISATNSNPQSTIYVYAGRTVTASDPYGNTKTTVTDVKGWLRKITDALGYTVTRAYDPAGSLTGISDSVGNTLLSNVTYAYGVNSFLLGASDADRGAWTYTVDSLGERTGWQDAKAQSFSMTYDALSRPLTRTEPDLFTQWTWGSTPASYNVGQLITECTGSSGACSSSSGYSESRTFDSAGRLSTRSITEAGNPGNDSGGVFLYTLGYSATTGFLNTLTYPKSTSFALTLQYGYGYGLLQSVTDTSDTTSTCGATCVLWTANAANGFGEVTQETLGNGVVTNRSYDAVTSWLTGATAGVGGGAALLNQSYLEDQNGNVTQRQNNNLGLTESFTYDNDHRLTCATLSPGCSTPTFVYDGGTAGPGNITTQVGVGTYTYPAAGQPRPHAVTSITGTFNGITNPTFSYDANGNMTDRASSSANITWSSYNYPVAISASDATGSEEVQFVYGPDRKRWKQIYAGPSGTEQTYYVGSGARSAPGQLEVVFSGSTNYRHYIYAGGEPVAVYSRTSAGVNTMSYMLEDHQGGVSAIASNAGAADIDESFTAFGQRRNPNTWSGAPAVSDLTTIAGLSRQGSTFQTWLGQSMGLNHMNGRVQDAILGRFLSPDPHIPDPSSAQSYNRYSYVNNNPLTMADPTGFDDGPCAYCQTEPFYGQVNSGINASFTYNFGTAQFDVQGGYYNSSYPNGVPASGTGNDAGSSRNPIAAFNQWATGWIDPTVMPSGNSQGFDGDLAQSQTASGGSTVWNDPNDATAGVTAYGNVSSSSAGIGSDIAGWSGLALSGVETLSGTAAVSLRYGVYRSPWINQYGAARSLSGIAHVGGWFTLGAGTFFDLWDYSEGGPDAPSLTQVSTNAGVGIGGMLGGPLTVLPASQYFLFQQLYNNFYPGGSSQAFSDLGGYLGNMSETGLGP